MGSNDIPQSVLRDPKTGEHPKTAAEFAAQNKRISDWLVQKAAEDAAKKFEEGK